MIDLAVSAALPSISPGSTSPISQAIHYVHTSVQEPALLSSLPTSIKSKVKHADTWLSRFKRVGDLLAYLKRFDVRTDDPVYTEMKKCGLLTFEDIVGDFERRFGQWANDCTRISDFIIGERYSVFDILIFARNYETRAGGMFVLEANGQPTAVVIKATLKDGRYANEWIDEPTTLKYYLKSINEDFGEHFKTNKAIIDFPNLPVVTFVRDSKIMPFIFRGVFRNQDLIREDGGAKAFVLTLNLATLSETVVESKYVATTLTKKVARSAQSLREQRLKRLALAPKRPIAIKVLTTSYDRNPDVIAEVLYRAKGICEECAKPAPFLRSKDGTPYLEVHHRIQLADGGDDTVINALALCPNCHREQHYGAVQSDPHVDPISKLNIPTGEVD